MTKNTQLVVMHVSICVIILAAILPEHIVKEHITITIFGCKKINTAFCLKKRLLMTLIYINKWQKRSIKGDEMVLKI